MHKLNFVLDGSVASSIPISKSQLTIMIWYGLSTQRLALKNWR